MARTRGINLLTTRKVETAKGPARYADGGGLYLRVERNGTRRWVFRFTLPGVRKSAEMGLGSAGKGGVTLAEARVEADQARECVRRGINPAIARKEERGPEAIIPTFGDYADSVLEDILKPFKNEKHKYQWRKTLESVGPKFRSKRVDAITRDDVMAVLKPIWDIKHETAARLRGRIEHILNLAADAGLRSGDNPAAAAYFNRNLTKRRKLTRGHLSAMPCEEIRAFLSGLKLRDGLAARALEFLILTAARSGEVRLATWSEFDIDKRVWIVPAHRMKMKKEHIVPLTERMIEILQEVKPLSGGTGLVFPGQKKGKPLSDSTLRAVMHRMGVSDVTAHGFRSAFRDWAGNETHFPREIAEEALSHHVGNEVERAYRRKAAIEKRRTMMEAWESYCLGLENGTNVVPLMTA